MPRDTTVQTETKGPPPLSHLLGQLSSSHLHGLVIDDGTDRVLRAVSAGSSVSEDVCGTSVLPQLLNASINPKSQVN